MSRNWLLVSVGIGVVAALVSVPAPVPAAEDKKDDLKKRVEETVEKGLEWLKRTQAQDGHWEAQGGQYPTTMTALAGMCFLMEGSTLKEGKYSDQVQKAVNWFLKPNRQQPNGCSGDVHNPTESQRYMYGHGFGTMFLASVYGEEEDKEQREKLEKALKKAVEFIAKAQTTKKHKKPEGKEVEVGGWGYVSATDGANFDEGSVTITQVQALRAARNAGIPVPKETIDKAVAYLEACTTPKGGVIYSYANSGGNGPERSGAVADHGRRRVVLLRRRSIQRRSGQEVDQVLQGQHPLRQRPAEPRRIPELLLLPVRIHSGGRPLRRNVPRRRQGHLADLEQVQGSDVSVPHRQPGQEQRRLDHRLHRPGLLDRGQPDHPSIGEGNRPHLPTLIRIHENTKVREKVNLLFVFSFFRIFVIGFFLRNSTTSDRE